jgi:hypothetical protein
MATLSQIEANRRNAQNSTGPLTPEGKAISSMNALKTGIDAESSVIPGEDAAALAALTERFHQDCQPQTAIESLLVDNIVRAAWRLRRFDRIDAEILIYVMEDTNYPSPNGPIGMAFHQSSTTQSRLQRRINDTSRLQREAIKDLQRLQAARPQPQPPAEQPVPQPTETEPPASPIGFVPQPHIPEPTPPPLAPAPGIPVEVRVLRTAPGPRNPAHEIRNAAACNPA